MNPCFELKGWRKEGGFQVVDADDMNQKVSQIWAPLLLFVVGDLCTQ